jgi:hypothetical protein
MTTAVSGIARSPVPALPAAGTGVPVSTNGAALMFSVVVTAAILGGAAFIRLATNRRAAVSYEADGIIML